MLFEPCFILYICHPFPLVCSFLNDTNVNFSNAIWSVFGQECLVFCTRFLEDGGRKEPGLSVLKISHVRVEFTHPKTITCSLEIRTISSCFRI